MSIFIDSDKMCPLFRFQETDTMWISEPYTTAPTDASCDVVTAAFALLDALHIPYTRVDHDTADTMEDCAVISDVDRKSVV